MFICEKLQNWIIWLIERSQAILSFSVLFYQVCSILKTVYAGVAGQGLASCNTDELFIWLCYYHYNYYLHDRLNLLTKGEDETDEGLIVMPAEK